MEEWRVIEGYDNYSVSNLGKVRNDKTGRILKFSSDKDGYSSVTLCKENKKTRYIIHRLVGFAFLENPNNFKQIDHINRIPNDNRVENLRWCSHGNNMRNKKKREGTTSKYLGIYLDKSNNKWRPLIRINGKKKHLGYFEKEEDAYEAWRACVFENNLQEFYGL
jgi:hypothetical protein